jgi:hypothetical protein
MPRRPAGMVVKTNRRIVQNYPLVKVRYGGDRVIGFHRWKKVIVQNYPLVKVRCGGGNDQGIRAL